MSINKLRDILQIESSEPQPPGFQERIDPKYFPLIVLDDIKVYEKKRFNLEKETHQLESINQKILLKILDEQSSIHQLLKAQVDQGAVLRQNGVVTPTNFIIIDTNKDPGHMVKGYTVKNDGPNPIFVAHNAALSSEVDADILDTVSNDSRFELLKQDDDIKFVYKNNCIRNIHILSQGGNSNFRAWLVW